ncbi:MAG: SAM-dependent methyltransferase [Salibacteraceae bacterium]|jgi:SAM-dependent methyltransferase
MTRNLGAVIIDQLRTEFIRFCFNELGNKDRLLDLGCGVKPFQTIYNEKVKSSVGLEVESTLHNQSNVDFFYDGVKLPFNDNEFDVVLSSEVMEHVPDPEKFLSEIYRVLRDGGVAIITVPFLVPLHEQPFDFYRYTEYSLKNLVKNANFSMEYLEVFGDYFSVLITLLIIPHLKFWNFFGKKIRLPILSTRLNPFVFVLIYLPQKSYLALKKLNVFRKIFSKMNYAPSGYGIMIKKNQQL